MNAFSEVLLITQTRDMNVIDSNSMLKVSASDDIEQWKITHGNP